MILGVTQSLFYLKTTKLHSNKNAPCFVYLAKQILFVSLTFDIFLTISVYPQSLQVYVMYTDNQSSIPDKAIVVAGPPKVHAYIFLLLHFTHFFYLIHKYTS